MKKWKRFALVAAAACLAALLAVGLWRLGSVPSGPGPSPSAALAPSPASQAPAPSAPQSAAPPALPSPAPSEPPPATPAPSAVPTPGPSPSGAGRPAAPSPAPQEEETGTAELCVLSVRCGTLLDKLDRLELGKRELVPADGVLVAETAEEVGEGESAFDLLKRVCERQGVHLEFSITPGYGSAYIEGIGNLYEFDCGDRSGWVYRVNGLTPSVGCSAYTLQPGDKVEFLYTCDWGNDL